MGTSSGSPAGDPLPAGTRGEVLHSSERARVTRLFLPGGHTVVVKEPLGDDAPRRARHETAILRRLRGTEGIAQLADGPVVPDAVVMQDAGGVTLDRRPMPVPVADVIAIGAELAR